MVTINDAPCKDCLKRHLKCHSQCPLYKEWKVERRKSEKAIYELKSRSYECERRSEK